MLVCCCVSSAITLLLLARAGCEAAGSERRGWLRAVAVGAGCCVEGGALAGWARAWAQGICVPSALLAPAHSAAELCAGCAAGAGAGLEGCWHSAAASHRRAAACSHRPRPARSCSAVQPARRSAYSDRPCARSFSVRVSRAVFCCPAGSLIRSMFELVCAIAPVISTPTAAAPRRRFVSHLWPPLACPPAFLNLLGQLDVRTRVPGTRTKQRVPSREGTRNQESACRNRIEGARSAGQLPLRSWITGKL